jgi:putative phosphoribosyl transferase
MRFEDRRQAGVMLGEHLAGLAPADPVVEALPRGGVPVGFEVARVLGCDLDVLLVRKVGVPGQPELAMGAVAEGGVVIRNPAIVDLVGLVPGTFDELVAREEAVLAGRAAAYRTDHPTVDPAGRTALIVDDGLATGATALAAVEALRQREAGEVWVCVPVAPRDTVAVIGAVADRVVALQQPRSFGAVGAWYRDFAQTEDDEVRALLARSRLR